MYNVKCPPNGGANAANHADMFKSMYKYHKGLGLLKYCDKFYIVLKQAVYKQQCDNVPQ